MMIEPFKIVFSDEYLVVVDKIAKVLVEPSGSKEKHTLTSLLQAQIKENVFACHRLDRETTGLVIFAKSRQIQQAIMGQFREAKVKKRYIAFVREKTPRFSGVIEGKIIDQHGKRFGEPPKQAKTFYKCLERFPGFTVVELIPVTGRTNQLRIQLAQLGCPILGERQYAFGRDFEVKFRRLALHAYFVSFFHPVSRERVNLQINLAADMADFLQNCKS